MEVVRTDSNNKAEWFSNYIFKSKYSKDKN